MKPDHTAKLWVASFPSEEARDRFFREEYDVDGNASCSMWTDLGITWFDHDYQEVINEGWTDYVRSIAQEPLPQNWLESGENTALLLFDIDGPVDAAQSGLVMRYLGQFRVKL